MGRNAQKHLMKNWKIIFWIYFTLSTLIIGFLINDAIDNAFYKIDNSIRQREKAVDIEILSKCINENNIPKDSLIEVLRKTSIHKKRSYRKSDTIQANSILLIYQNEKVVKVLKADT
jgi:hypothetical protein